MGEEGEAGGSGYVEESGDVMGGCFFGKGDGCEFAPVSVVFCGG